MRISDWSSDVCSSDLPARAARELLWLAAAVTVAIPLTHGLATGMWPWTSAVAGHWAPFWVDAVALAMAFAFARLARASTRRAREGAPNSVWATPSAGAPPPTPANPESTAPGALAPPYGRSPRTPAPNPPPHGRATGMWPWTSAVAGHWAPFWVDAVALAMAFAFARLARASTRRAREGEPNSVWANP